MTGNNTRLGVPENTTDRFPVGIQLGAKHSLHVYTCYLKPTEYLYAESINVTSARVG